MNNKKDETKINELGQVGSFTKNAVKSFESNIVCEKDYLEKVKNK
jgi:hypothetical protein